MLQLPFPILVCFWGGPPFVTFCPSPYEIMYTCHRPLSITRSVFSK